MLSLLRSPLSTVRLIPFVSDPAGRPVVYLDAFALGDPARSAGLPDPAGQLHLDTQPDALVGPMSLASPWPSPVVLDKQSQASMCRAVSTPQPPSQASAIVAVHAALLPPSARWSALPDSIDCSAAGRGLGGLRLGGPRSGFVVVERGWREPPPCLARPDQTAKTEGGEAGADTRRRARDRKESASDDPAR